MEENKALDNKNELEKVEKNKKEIVNKEEVSDSEGLQMVSLSDISHIEKEPEKKNKNFVFNKIIRIGITIVAAIVFIISAFQLCKTLYEYKKGDELYDDILESYTKVSLRNDTEEDTGEDYVDDGIMPYVKIDVDFDGLKKINSDVVGWIQFEHVNISYPIVKTKDNSYYLTHTIKKTENKEGSIYMDYKNDKNFSDMNTIIYGHNMKNGSMFGLLGKYKNADFYQGRECFWIYTPTADYRYMIFSCYEPKASDKSVYSFWTSPCEEQLQYILKAKERSKYPTSVQEFSQEDKIVTLSTCTSAGKEYRFVVQGKLIQTVEK